MLHPVIPTSHPVSPPLHPVILPLHTAKSPIYPVHLVTHCYIHVTPWAECRIQICVSLLFSVLRLLHKIMDFTVHKLGRHVNCTWLSFQFQSRLPFKEQFILVGVGAPQWGGVADGHQGLVKGVHRYKQSRGSPIRKLPEMSK